MAEPFPASPMGDRPSALYEALEEEADALGLMSYHGIGTAKNGETMWRADLDPMDVGKIRALISLAASELARLQAESDTLAAALNGATTALTDVGEDL